MAELQVTSESLFQEAFESQAPVGVLDRKHLEAKMAELEEVDEYQGRKRTEFENALRKNYHNIKAWTNYARFEVGQRDMRRARSVFERSLTHNKASVQLWTRYIRTEIEHKNVNHARNLLERATRILPYQNKIWFLYVELEESIRNYDKVREIYDNWLIYEPQSRIYELYIEFELRRGADYGKVRKIFERFIVVHPESETWIKWISFEDKYGDLNSTRQVLALSVDTLLELQKPEQVESILIAWIEVESAVEEFERCKGLFEFGLRKLPKEYTNKLFNFYLKFEKKFSGTTDKFYTLLVDKRKRAIELEMQESQTIDYDLYWEYLNILISSNNDQNEIIETFEQVLQNVPVDSKKSINWRKFDMICKYYLYYMEVELKNIPRTRQLYQKLANDIFPHERFTFEDIWINFAKFEIRNGSLDDCRKVLGLALGKTNFDYEVFKFYLSLESDFKQVDRIRKLYESFLMKNPENCKIWLKYINFEVQLDETERAEALFETLIGLWHKEHDFFTEQDVYKITSKYADLLKQMFKFEEARKFFQEFDKKTVRLWIDWAIFEASCPSEEQLEELKHVNEEEDIEIEPSEESLENARKIFEDGLKHYKNEPNERVLLFEGYKQFEEAYGDAQSLEKVTKRMPTMMKNDIGDIEYKFPDDEVANEKMMKFLQRAQMWKKNN